MSKFVDNERLARLAKALDARMKAKVAAEEARAKAAEEALAGRLDVIEGEAEGSIKKAVADLAARHDEELDAAEARLDALEAKFEGDESVDGKIAAAKQEALDAVAEEKERAEAAEKALVDRLDVIEGEGEGSVKKAQADAQAYADQKIADLVNSAPEAMDTLKELADEIGKNQGIYDAYVAEHAAAMAQQKADLQAEIDADVKVEADRAVAREAELQGEIDAAEERLDAVEGRAAALEAKVGHDVEGEEPATGLFLEVDEARAAADQAQDEVDAVEERMTAAEGEIDALQQNAQEAAENVAQQVQAINEAINAEKERAEGQEAAIRGEFAEADEALHAQVKAEMAAVIQSLVAEITEEGMLRIALGGIEGDDVLVIKEQEIPFVTDEEIDAIIAGLDEEEPQA